jgi:serine/threonine protein kinase
MERLCSPYLSLHDHLSSSNILPSTDWTLHSFHYVLQMLNTYFYPKHIIHGDLHNHNIFVHNNIGTYMHVPAPVKFIDFGRTICLDGKFSVQDIFTLMSIDVMALLRAACRQCLGTTNVERRGRRHAQAQAIKNMLTNFLAINEGMVSMDTLERMVPKLRVRGSQICPQCSVVYDWVDALLRYPMFPNKEGRLSFLDITAG